MSKTIFITGTSTGFGKLMTITLSKEGHTVIAGMRESRGRNKSIASELTALPNVDVVEIDVTDDNSVKVAFEYALNKYEHIDVLVNNAGLAGFGLTEAYSIDQIKQLFEVNFYGVIRTYQAVLPSMRKAKSGLIINLTSGASGHALPFMGPYLASKFSVEAVTEAIQDELSQFNIENVTIQPGVYPTEMNTGKPGVSADRTQIAKEYDPIATEMFNAIGAALFGKMEEFKMNPQVIADGVLNLINMKNGTRPLRYPLDAIANGTDVEFINARAENKKKWVTAYTS
ncbi:SDR family oxidoreductase [Chryseosolibacter indicus]|uniref:SDR family oxidoreductase n=1 Tax=Chryseosolibacter indicus TaxID=2782351 RepID=A0ABS5VUC0_9BACT|nr:SDR family oxidoreductase [Chryseosolibacter indicus]MBT1704931.1 SDR family oxidoreductase [Chryseosolibacter indicus]